MVIKEKVLPLVLSGTLAFGTMGVPVTALAADNDVAKQNAAAEKAVNAEMDAKAKADAKEKAQAVQQDTEKAKAAVVEAQASEPAAEPAEPVEPAATPEDVPAESTTDEGESDPDAAKGSVPAGESGGEQKPTDEQSGETPQRQTLQEKIDSYKDTDQALWAALNAMASLPDPTAVTASHKDIIVNARGLHDGLNDGQKAIIKGDEDFLGLLNKLVADEEAIKKLESAQPADPKPPTDQKTDDQKAADAAQKAADDQAAAQAVADILAALPAADAVKASDERAVYAAKEAYDKLSKDQKALVGADLVQKMRDAVKAVDKAVVDERKTAEKAAAEKASREKASAATKSAQDRAAAAVRGGDTYNSSYSGQGYTRIKYTANLSTEMFIASIGEQARQIGQEKSLYASVMIAQAIIESDSGNSTLSQAPNYNLFGIKGAYQGQSVNMATQEDNGSGGLYGINSDFRRYGNQRESLSDYAELLRNDMGHYYNAWKENAPTYQDAAKALQGTYATSTIYADSICAVIEAYDLTRFDEPLKYTVEGTMHDPESPLADDKGNRPMTMDDYVALQGNAISYLGTPYVWGGTTPDGFDCSGFVRYLYQQTFGIDLPRTTYAQQHEGEEVPFSDLQMGDLLFFSDGGSTEHVAMYLGEGFYIHAPEPGDVVKISDMESYTPTFAKRILKTVPVTDETPIPGEEDAAASDDRGQEADGDATAGNSGPTNVGANAVIL